MKYSRRSPKPKAAEERVQGLAPGGVRGRAPRFYVLGLGLGFVLKVLGFKGDLGAYPQSNQQRSPRAFVVFGGFTASKADFPKMSILDPKQVLK
jgi:hypothetical protein